VIRLPANRVLQDKIGYLLKCPVGQPPHKVRRYFASFSYQAQSWTQPRRGAGNVARSKLFGPNRRASLRPYS
jgi:hypothetical protein